MTLQFQMHLRNEPAQIRQLQERLTDLFREHGVTDNTVFRLNLCLEELLVNTMTYGFEQGSAHDIAVQLEVREGLLRVEIVDDGIPFDPFADAPQPDLQAPIEQRPIGGLGVHLVKSLMDSVEYRFHENRNHVCLTLGLSSPGAIGTQKESR